MKKVLLTGAGGFFGSHLLRHLLMGTDWQIDCIVSFRHKGMPERIENAQKGYEGRVNVITHDLTAPFTWLTKEIIGKPDYILNIASNSHVDDSITNPAQFAVENFQLVVNMLELAREIKPEVFWQFSTDEVYGPAPDGYDYKEGERHRPSNPYSASKSAQEQIAFSYWRTFGVPVIISNTMNLLGETQGKEKFPALLIRKIEKGEEVTIHGSEDNIGSRYYLHARNGADALLYVLKNFPPTMYDETDHTDLDRYNIVGDLELNNLELAEMTAEIMGKELKYRLEDFHSTRPGHDRRYALSGKKLKDLGWTAPMDFRKSLKSSIEWTLRNKNWL